MTENNPDADDSGDEFELEPVDPEILEFERRRAIHKTRTAEDSVDIEELYVEAEPDDPIDFGEFKKFRFTIRHLLIVTALLSVVMTVGQLAGPCNAVLLTIVASVAAGWWVVLQRERRQQARQEGELAQLKEKIAAQRAREDGEEIKPTPQPASVAIPHDTPSKEPKFDFSFSLKQMFGAFTAAALLLGLVQFVGGSQNAAMLLGLIALAGLALTAIGFDPPRVVILSWWLLMVLYLVVSLWAAFGDDQASVPRPKPTSPTLLVGTGNAQAQTKC